MRKRLYFAPEIEDWTLADEDQWERMEATANKFSWFQKTYINGNTRITVRIYNGAVTEVIFTALMGDVVLALDQTISRHYGETEEALEAAKKSAEFFLSKAMK